MTRLGVLLAAPLIAAPSFFEGDKNTYCAFKLVCFSLGSQIQRKTVLLVLKPSRDPILDCIIMMELHQLYMIV